MTILFMVDFPCKGLCLYTCLSKKLIDSFTNTNTQLNILVFFLKQQINK